MSRQPRPCARCHGTRIVWWCKKEDRRCYDNDPVADRCPKPIPIPCDLHGEDATDINRVGNEDRWERE